MSAEASVMSEAQRFGYRPGQVAFWRKGVRNAIAAGARTPFYLFALKPLQDQVKALDALDFGVRTTLWLSFKTQPLRPLVEWWTRTGRPVEIVSEFECRSAIAAGCPAPRLLANGPAKHRWLAQAGVDGMNVNFDSLREIELLAPQARARKWRVGLRLRSTGETDPEHADCPTQFGLETNELPAALSALRREGLTPEILHTHLRTNVPDPSWWTRAADQLVGAANAAGWHPPILDLGGGLPAPHTRNRNGGFIASGYDPALDSYRNTVRRIVRSAGHIQELWLEHGRHVSAGAGVLVVRVIDSKKRCGRRMLICDGGRTMNALVSLWEDHAILPLKSRRGPTMPTVIHGPTCMAFDQLGERQFAASVEVDDLLLWMGAGAYHLPWETRFSHGLAEIWWDAGDALRCVRSAETWEDYWRSVEGYAP